jgi:AmmeMemoRadiSam system protein A
MSSAEARSPEIDGLLVAVARGTISLGLSQGRPPQVDPDAYPEPVRAPGASFVTLRLDSALRGCTGSLEAARPLVCDVARNAWRSATADPRFSPLREAELAELDVHVSVLSPLEPVAAASERELLAQLRPGIDGLVLREGRRCATFLPAVWENLPEPREFLDQLRLKAGLPRGHWSAALRFERYTTRDG